MQSGTAATALPLILISASQIGKYRECHRSWAWNYIGGFRTESGASAALGTEVDDEQVQPYLKDGREFDHSKPARPGFLTSAAIAESMRAYLPKPKTVEVQKHFVMPSPTTINGKHIGFGFQGYMDIWADDSALIPGAAGDAPGVADTKTTVDVNRWAKSAQTLSTDVQAMLYATSAMFETGARTVDLAWIYGQTKKTTRAKTVHLRVTSDYVAEQFGAINETAVEMLGVRKGAPPGVDDIAKYVLDIEPNPDACESFGGCPYRDKCNLSPGQIIDALAAKAERRESIAMSNAPNPTMSMLERLKAEKARKMGGVPGAHPSPNVPGVVAPVPPTPAAPVPVAPPAPTPGVTFNPSWQAAAVIDSMATPIPLPLGINPPESLLPPAPPVGQVEAALTATPTKRTRGPNKAKGGEAPALPSGFALDAETATAFAELASDISAAFTKYAAKVAA